MLDKLENTICHSNYGRPHSVSEKSPRFPIIGKLSPYVKDGFPSNPEPIKYKVLVICRFCDKTAYLDQYNNVLESHNDFSG